MMKTNALVPIAPGFEEIEAVSVIDVLRRAGVEVTVAVVPAAGQSAGLPASLEVTASRGVRLVGDCLLDDCLDQNYSAIVLPGGMPGAEHLRDSIPLRDLMIEQDRRGDVLAAICASPAIVLAHHDLIRDRRATCFPQLMDQLPAGSRSAERVVTAGNLITSRGPGTALEFALAVVKALCGQEKMDEIAGQLVLPRNS
jgi:4-methyl-5(b-hydroxyethyl)-thiazole monophosphate biosynthesis